MLTHVLQLQQTQINTKGSVALHNTQFFYTTVQAGAGSALGGKGGGRFWEQAVLHEALPATTTHTAQVGLERVQLCSLGSYAGHMH